MTSDGQVHSISRSDLKLFQMGENGRDPENSAFYFTAGMTSLTFAYRLNLFQHRLTYLFVTSAGGEEYLLEMSVMGRVVFFYGREWEARIVERMCRFRLNGLLEGCGFSEFDYR